MPPDWDYHGYLEQADGTAWMALFTQNMAELAVELASHDKTYEDIGVKFLEHFLYIAAALNKPGQDGMWDEEDGFYYDLLRLPAGSASSARAALNRLYASNPEAAAAPGPGREGCS